MLWQILNHSKITNNKSITTALLVNRGLTTKKEIENFISPIDPLELTFKDLGIKKEQLNKVLKRLKQAKTKKEKVVIFGDYDADGVCATAILWEAMYKLGFDVLPYIPDRFEEGYGLKPSSFERLKSKNLDAKLVITVDNGVVAHEGIKEANKQGIDVIIVDHHTKASKKLGTPYILHSTAVCGSALAWFLSRELTSSRELGGSTGLDLVALGTIADQMPLLGVNRSLVKYGLPELLKTKRVGLHAMFKDLKIDSIGTYEVGYLIAPRINAMGRLASATDALRFLCTRDPKKAGELNTLLNKTNIERQGIVDKVITEVLKQVQDSDKVMVIEGNYHEGVIGLASGKVTEKYYKPSIVLSVGEKISKASARSIHGFNIIETIKETGLILEGGGHPMAAGFSIETVKIQKFRTKINQLAQKTLTDELLERKLRIDLELRFDQISNELIKELKQFEPSGYGNFPPIFTSKQISIIDVKPVGSEGKHLKMKLEQNRIKFDAIWFNANNQKFKANDIVDLAYSIEENVWNNKTSIQLKIKDLN